MTYNFVTMGTIPVSGETRQMKKSELIAALTEKSGLTKPQAAAAISALTEIIT
jgi:hypothetical protein